MKIYSVLFLILVLALVSCGGAEEDDRNLVNSQQTHYAQSQPLHFYDYSIPRDVLQQIYDVVTTKSVATYTVIESITGQVKFKCQSIGYAIPVDTQLTNPLRPAWGISRNSGEVIEQAEPNGLFSSKNTDGTWVLCVNETGLTYPFYTEHKVSTWPFIVVQNEHGEWLPVEGATPNVQIDTTNIRKEIDVQLGQ